MAEFGRRVMQGAAVGQTAAVDEGLRSYMLRVYNYMTLGVGVTGIVTLFMAANPELLYTVAVGQDVSEADRQAFLAGLDAGPADLVVCLMQFSGPTDRNELRSRRPMVR